MEGASGRRLGGKTSPKVRFPGILVILRSKMACSKEVRQLRKMVCTTVSFLLLLVLLSACAPSVPPASPSPTPSPPGGGTGPGVYTGFMAPAEGQWAEYVISTNGQESRQKMEHIGRDTVSGRSCIGFEMTMSGLDEEDTVIQIWTDASTHQAVKYVMKMGDQVLCMNIAPGAYEPPETETPSKYNPNLPNISYGTYTTPTGKTVNVAKFGINGGQTWVSSQVPFGMVKVIDAGGKTSMYLYDFGTSGARRDISRAEMENCLQMPN